VLGWRWPDSGGVEALARAAIAVPLRRPPAATTGDAPVTPHPAGGPSPTANSHRAGASAPGTIVSSTPAWSCLVRVHVVTFAGYPFGGGRHERFWQCCCPSATRTRPTSITWRDANDRSKSAPLRYRES